jgi:hypothetical protein
MRFSNWSASDKNGFAWTGVALPLVVASLGFGMLAFVGDCSRLSEWRRDRLRSAGFPADLAERLAHQHTADLHALLELVDRDCPPELAARILAPLEEEPSPS